MRNRKKQTRLEARRALVPLALALAVSACTPKTAAPCRSDLRLEWSAGTGTGVAPRLIEGELGAQAEAGYVILNDGLDRAAAVVLTSHSTLGVLSTRRLAPGPAPGQSVSGRVHFELEAGLREICLEVRSQHIRADIDEDPTPENNRLCREVRVHARPEEGGVATTPLETGQQNESNNESHKEKVGRP